MSGPDEIASVAQGDTLEFGATGSGRDLTGVTLGDFLVERLLGRGGMGEVYLARQVSLNRPVALKVLRHDLLAKPTYLSRFEAEAAAVAKLNHPNIVHVYMLGSIDGIRYIAMEYVQGTNLREYILKKGAIDYPLAFSIMRQAGVAVGAAGELGLVHRDIKPENLLLTRKGQVKVADFGLCRDIDAGGLHLTQTGMTLGTPLYMSPEQAQGHPLDHRSDLYSLGVTFYHMIAGTPPFKAESAVAMALKHVKERPVSLAVHRPDVPPDLDRLVMKLMAKSPADRYQSAGEMLRDLARARELSYPRTTVPSLLDLPNVSSSSTLPSSNATATPPATIRETPVPPTVAAAAPPIASRFAAASIPSTTAVATDAGPTLAPRFRLRFGRREQAGLVLLGLALGAALGAYSRPDDLLTSRPDEPRGMPGLWMAPKWTEVNKLATAEEQYLWAQVRAPSEMLDAAWLAVPGHFPGARNWASLAYTQLGRRLVHQRDAERLGVFAKELDRWTGRHKHDEELATILRAGAKAMEGDLDGVLADFEQQQIVQHLTDPALLELSLDVTAEAQRVAGAGVETRLAGNDIRKLRESLIRKFIQTETREPDVHPQ